LTQHINIAVTINALIAVTIITTIIQRTSPTNPFLLPSAASYRHRTPIAAAIAHTTKPSPSAQPSTINALIVVAINHDASITVAVNH
jgi:hypothetical protein